MSLRSHLSKRSVLGFCGAVVLFAVLLLHHGQRGPGADAPVHAQHMGAHEVPSQPPSLSVKPSVGMEPRVTARAIASDPSANVLSALEAVPEELLAWAALHEKSLRTEEDQSVYEISTVGHLGEALSYLSSAAEPLSFTDRLQDLQSEVARVWYLRVVAEALKLPALSRGHLAAIDAYLAECAGASAPTPSDPAMRQAGQAPALAHERLLDCVSVAHSYARERPRDWDELKADAPLGFAVIAQVAERYSQLE